MTPEQTVAAAAEIVARSTRSSGVPVRVEDGAVLDELAGAVAETMLSLGGDRGGPRPRSRPGPAKAPVAPGNPSSPKEKPEHGQP